MSLKPCTRIWLLLMLLTLVTFLIGWEGGIGASTLYVVLAIAVLKAQLVADHFMGLREVAGFWRPLLSVYLAILATGIALAFMLTP